MTMTMKIIHVNPKKLTLDAENPNRMTKSQLAGLSKSIEKFGFLVPIIIDENNAVINGHQRLQAAQSLNLTKIPAVRAADLSEDDKLMLTQTLNKLTGTHDPRKDLAIFQKLLKANKMDEFSGLIAKNSNTLLKNLKKYTEPPQITPQTRVKKGQTWKLGRHTVHCGDVMETPYTVDDYDLILTDPPYGVNAINSKHHTTNMSNKGISGKIAHQKIDGDAKPFDPAWMVDTGKPAIIFGGNYMDLPVIKGHWLVWLKIPPNQFRGTDLSDAELAWTNMPYRKTSAYYHLWSGLIKAGPTKLEGITRQHPTQKPVGLFIDIIKDHTKTKGISTIYDPYGGSGSVLLACEETGHTCLTCEIEPIYCDVILSRWEALTGQKATKIT